MPSTAEIARKRVIATLETRYDWASARAVLAMAMDAAKLERGLSSFDGTQVKALTSAVSMLEPDLETQLTRLVPEPRVSKARVSRASSTSSKKTPAKAASSDKSSTPKKESSSSKSSTKKTSSKKSETSSKKSETSSKKTETSSKKKTSSKKASSSKKSSDSKKKSTKKSSKKKASKKS